MRSLLRYLIGRRVARVLPGGWLGLLLLSPQARGFVRNLWRRRRAR